MTDPMVQMRESQDGTKIIFTVMNDVDEIHRAQLGKIILYLMHATMLRDQGNNHLEISRGSDHFKYQIGNLILREYTQGVLTVTSTEQAEVSGAQIDSITKAFSPTTNGMFTNEVSFVDFLTPISLPVPNTTAFELKRECIDYNNDLQLPQLRQQAGISLLWQQCYEACSGVDPKNYMTKLAGLERQQKSLASKIDNVSNKPSDKKLVDTLKQKLSETHYDYAQALKLTLDVASTANLFANIVRYVVKRNHPKFWETTIGYWTLTKTEKELVSRPDFTTDANATQTLFKQHRRDSQQQMNVASLFKHSAPTLTDYGSDDDLADIGTLVQTPLPVTVSS